jgi:hypothetical protein
MQNKLRDILYLLEELQEYMDQRADVDEDTPNKEMQFLVCIQETIEVIKEELGE